MMTTASIEAASPAASKQASPTLSNACLIHEHALHLIDALTAPVEARANAEEVRAQPFMKAAIQEMEKFAGHMADTRS
eukprot:s4754_g6.t1